MPNSKGIVFFAYNSKFDYVKLTNLAAALTKKFLGLPVTVITDLPGSRDVDPDVIDKVIVRGSDHKNIRSFQLPNGQTISVDWRNAPRSYVWDVSPYDQTLLLDCDYLVFSDSLLKVFDTDIEFSCPDTVHDVTGLNTFASCKRLGPYSIPMLWATLIYFTKTERAESIFSMMKMVEENYHYYSKAYNFIEHPFRNDYTLSIAHHTMSGYRPDHTTCMPQKLMTLSSQFNVVDFRENGDLVFSYPRGEKTAVNRLRNTDIHIMDKSMVDNSEIYERMLSYAKI